MNAVLPLLAALQASLAGARADLDAGRVARAIESLAPVVAAPDSPPEALAILAEAWAAVQRHDLAEPILRRLETGPLPSTASLLSLAERLAEGGRIARAGSLLESSLARRAEDADLLLGLARQRAGLGKPAETIALLDRRGDRGDAASLYLGGAALRALGREVDAEVALRRAVAAAPTHASAQEELGLLLEAKGDVGGALRAFEAALAADGNRPASSLGRARLVARSGRKEEADLAFLRFRVLHAFEEERKLRETEVRENPASAAPCAALGCFLVEHRQFRKSLPVLRRALELAPEDAEAAAVLARALAALREWAEAETLYASLRARFPGRGDFSLRLAEIAEERGSPEPEIRRLLDETARAGCREAAFPLALGRAEWRAGRAEEAVLRFREATALEPGSLEAWRALALALGRLGRGEEAEREIRAALEREPSNGAPRAALAALLEESGKTGEAAAERRIFERSTLESRLRPERR